MTINEQIQLKLDRGMSLDDAINEIARQNYMTQLCVEAMDDGEYSEYISKFDKPLLDWIENK